MKRMISVATICVLALCISCSGGNKKEEALMSVKVATVTKGSIANTVLFTGNIDAQDAVNVFSRGYGKITKKLLKEGDPVKKGQTILMADRDDIGYSFKAQSIESPIDGVIGTINVDVGTFVYPRDQFDKNPVAVVVRPGDMRVKLDVPERYVGDLSIGTPVEMKVDSIGESVFPGTISSISALVDAKTRTARVEVSVPNPDGKLRHGMFGRIELAIEKKDDTLAAPYDAISWEGEKRFAYKLDGTHVRRLPVVTGLRNHKNVEILEGLKDGDVVVEGNLIELEDGKEVSVSKTKEIK